MKIVYVDASLMVKDEGRLLKIISSYKGAFIASTSQFEGVLSKVKQKDKGVILGCNVCAVNHSDNKVVLFVGDGLFHPLMIKMDNPEKKVLMLNPFTFNLNEVKDSDIKKFNFREAVGVDAVLNAKKVGVLVSTKAGQNRLNDALKLKKKLESLDKNVFLFLSETINPDEFLNFKGLDALVNTACPRLALDDYNKFPVPIINYSACIKAIALALQ